MLFEVIGKLFKGLWYVFVELPISLVVGIVFKIFGFVFSPIEHLFKRVKRLEEAAQKKAEEEKCTSGHHIGEPIGECIICRQMVCDNCGFKERDFAYHYECYERVFNQHKIYEKERKERLKRDILAIIDFSFRLVLSFVLLFMLIYIGVWIFCLLWTFYKPSDVMNLLNAMNHFDWVKIKANLGPTWANLKRSFLEILYGKDAVKEGVDI